MSGVGIHFLSLIVISLMGMSKMALPAAVPAFSIEKIDQIPDLCQTDPRADFPEGGREFCCIAAISNSLMWLAEHGYPNLIDKKEESIKTQVALCKRLASRDYMNTDPKQGTGTTNIMRGLKKYVEDRGYDIGRLEYRGWRDHPAEMKARSSYAALDWIREGILNNGSVWLNIGWYQYDPSNDTYQRLSGHWVTVAGYGKNEKNLADPDILILHDPSGRTGRSFANEYVQMHSIQSGTLTGPYSGLPRSAKGFLKTGSGMHVKLPADCGIVDGAIVFVPSPPGIDNPVPPVMLPDKENAAEPPPSDEDLKDGNQILERIGNGRVWKDPPQAGPLQKSLTPAEREENFEILVQAIDRYFSFFIVKEIKWDSICQPYREKSKQVKSTPQFYQLLYQLVRQLKDAHSRLQDYEAVSGLEPYAPPITIRRIEGKAVVINVPEQSKAYRKGIRPGWILTSVNRKPFNQYLELLLDHASVSSSERNLLEKMTRMILCGKRDSRVQMDFLSDEGKPVRDVELARTVRYPETGPEPSFPLTRLTAVWYGTHSSGYGYIRILTFQGRMEIADEFDQALEALRGTKGLILDIRDNPGGYGTCQPRIIGRFLTEKASGTISYQRNGPKHDDFEERRSFIEPSGDWQYVHPVGLLMNSITGSASDLFAARCVSTGRVIPMGQTTHGNVTGVGVYVQLPCNLVVRVSNGYIADASGRIIEGNGTKPRIEIEPTLEDARLGMDGVLERAFLELGKQRAGEK